MRVQQSSLNKKMKIKNMTTPSVINSICRSLQRCGLLLIPLLFVCFGLPPRDEAVIPAPDGGYAGCNTAEGQTALFNLTTGCATRRLVMSLALTRTGQFQHGHWRWDTGSQHRMKIQRLALQHCYSTPPARTTRPMERSRAHKQHRRLRQHRHWLRRFSATHGPSGTANGHQGSKQHRRGRKQRPRPTVIRALNNTTGHDNTAIGLVRSVRTRPAISTSAWGSMGEPPHDRQLQYRYRQQGCCGRIQHHPHWELLCRVVHTATYIAGIAGVNQGTVYGCFYRHNHGQLGGTLSARIQERD